MSALGNHILVEFTGCSPEIMNDVTAIETNMVDAAKKAGATVINSTFHHFSPIGVSGVVVIQESHLAIHTWPEYGYAAVDLFTCGEIDSWVSFDFLQECFKSTNYSAIELKRGALQLLSRMDFNLESLRAQTENRLNPDKYTRNVWFTDRDNDQALSLRHTGEVLFKDQSPYQKVTVFNTYKYGKMLALDHMVMTTEEDEFHYHEMIAHPAIFDHGNVKNVLIIGGGDGGTAREVLRHDSIDIVTMVEIDEMVINACKEHLPNIAAAFDNPKLNLIVGDGIEFIKNTTEKYDLILVDGSDPVGPAEGLFSKSFYEHCYKALNNKGIIVAQGESPKFNETAFVDIHETLSSICGKENTGVRLFYVPTYPTGMWSFQYGTKNLPLSEIHPEDTIIHDFVSDKGLRYYNFHIHKASTALPNFVHSMLQPKTFA